MSQQQVTTDFNTDSNLYENENSTLSNKKQQNNNNSSNSNEIEQIQNVKKQIFKNLNEPEDCVEWLYKQRQHSYDGFEQIVKIGNQITRLTKEEQLNALENLLLENEEMIPNLTPYIQDAFEQVLTLRFNDCIRFFLERGLDLQENASDCLIILTKTARFFVKEPPSDTLEILLDHGADINQVERDQDGKYRTPLHLAAKYGIPQFVVLMCHYKDCEINPVDGSLYTPFGYAHEQRSKGKNFRIIADFLEEKGGVLDWKMDKK